MCLDLVVSWHGQCGQLFALKQIHDLYQHGTRKLFFKKNNYWKKQSITYMKIGFQNAYFCKKRELR